MTTEIKVDLAIIGAGTAGISAFKEASKVTKRILMIDHGPLGTTCARVGCMPSKALIQTSEFVYDQVHLDHLGICHTKGLNIDIPSVMKHVRHLRDHFTSSTIKYIESLGHQFIRGTAEICEPTILKIGQQKIIAKSIIIATGTSSMIPKEWQAFSNQLLISENIFEQNDFLKRIAVIGAGAIGLELGQALSRLGKEMTMFHAHKFIGELTDPIVNESALKIFREEFPLHINQRATLEKNNDVFLIKSGTTSLPADQVIAALGRQPNLSNLNLDKLGIKMDDSGIPIYDKTTTKIDNFPIYIAGDAGKFRPLLHEAADEGRIAGYNAVRDNTHCFTRRTPLMIIFTQPNIAIIGQSFNELQDTDIIIGDVNFEDQGRARMMMQNKGILRIYADRAQGKLLGAEMIAPAGEHLAHLLAFAIQQKMSIFDLLQMPFYHPVVEEGMRTALRKMSDQVSHNQHEGFDLVMCDSEAVSSLS